MFDDPTIKESLGWYYFDDEGVETKLKLKKNYPGREPCFKKIICKIKKKIKNRETSEISNTVPTGNMRGVPLAAAYLRTGCPHHRGPTCWPLA